MEKLKDIGIPQELFEEWREPREGTDNPTKTNNPVWNWLINTNLCAWSANQASDHDTCESATWCFDRMGQSVTQLQDGRTIYIAGEHEDFYDPDFYIYNDVVVKHPDGSLDIYIYPKNIFPPTDFHSATLVGEEIIVIGCLGYPEQRDAQDVHVFALNTVTFVMQKIETTGEKPGWIFKHSATLLENENTILICHGEKYRGQEKSTIENIHEWKLNVNIWKWELSKENQWWRWQYVRADKKRNLLWELNQLRWNKEAKWQKQYEEGLIKLTGELGHKPDLEILKSLYEPPVSFEKLPAREGGYNQTRLLIEGTIVRYVEEDWEIQVTIEGHLPLKTIELLKQDFYQKLTNLVQTGWDMTDIQE